MNERIPPPKLQNIIDAIKFETTTAGVGSGSHNFGRSRLVASLSVGSACWYSVDEANRHPEMLAMLKENLRLHLLRQLYQDNRHEMADACEAFRREWTPMYTSKENDPFAIRDRLMKAARYSPPSGFGEDDGSGCDRGANCGCEQFEFLLNCRPS